MAAKHLLRERYTTMINAQRRAAFENGVALSEYSHGWRPHLYAYRVVLQDTFYRVERFRPDAWKEAA